MRQRLNRAGILAFVLLVSIVGLSQTKRVNAELCPGALAHAGAFTPQRHCIKEYFSAGPLYNPTFSYSATSLSFRMPSMMWSALGNVIFTPSIQQKAAPNATTYWFLRISRSSPTGRLAGSFVSSTSSVSVGDEVLEYIVVSNRSGIASVRFPMPAQLVRIASNDHSGNRSIEQPGDANTSSGAEMLAQADVGVQGDSNGDGFFNGALQANP